KQAAVRAAAMEVATTKLPSGNAAVSANASPRLTRPEREQQDRRAQRLVRYEAVRRLPALCEMLAGRYTKRPGLIPSHKRLHERSLIVQEVALAAAIVDRIVHHGHVVPLKGPSRRAKDRPEMAGPPAEAAG